MTLIEPFRRLLLLIICTIGGHKNLGQTSQLYKVKNQKYTLGKFGFLQTRL
jgi:hypothetical protein